MDIEFRLRCLLEEILGKKADSSPLLPSSFLSAEESRIAPDASGVSALTPTNRALARITNIGA
jgi:hypothetical protein